MSGSCPSRCLSSHAFQNSSPSSRVTFSGRLSKKVSRIVCVVMSVHLFFSNRFFLMAVFFDSMFLRWPGAIPPDAAEPRVRR